MKKSLTTFLILSLLIVLTASSFAMSSEPVNSAEAEEKVAKPKKKVMAYLPTWKGKEWTAEDIQGEKLTHLLISFARINNQFEISDYDQRIKVPELEQSLPDIVSTEMITDRSWQEIKEVQEKYPHIKMIVAVGGWGAEGFSDMAATPETREIFVDSVVEYIEKHNLDGIDLDWEFPVNGGWGLIKNRPEDKENFTALIKLLREKLGEEKEISFCANVGGWYLDAVEIKKLAPLVDTINIMAYDFHGRWSKNTAHFTNLYPNPNDPVASWGLSGAQAVQRFIDAGVPAEKLVLGAASYGKAFYKTKPGPNGDGLFQKFNKDKKPVWRSSNIPYSKLEEYYINKNGFKRYWDDKAKAPYLYDGETFISYDDPESIKYKAQYVKEKDLAGIMYWEYTHDLDGDLLGSMYNVLKE